jgi:ATP-binding cassette subfamily B protein
MPANVLQEEEYTGQLTWSVWKRILRFARPYRGLVALLTATAVATAACEVAFGLIPRAVLNDVAAKGAAGRLTLHACAYFATMATFVVCIWSFIYLAGRISTHMAHDIRRDGFSRLQDLSFSFYDRRPVGWLVARLTTDCDRLSRTISWGCLDLVWGVCMLAGVSGAMLFIHWKLALVVLSVLPAMALTSLLFQRRILRASRKVRKTNSTITAAYNEGISGVRTTKALVREDENLREFQHLTGRMLDESVRSAVLSSMYMPTVLALASVGAGLALWQGGLEVMGKAIEVGTLFYFVHASGQFFFPIQELTRFLTDLQSAQAAAERITGLLDTEPEVRDSQEVTDAIERHRASPPRDGLACDGLGSHIETVEFRGVGFAYKDAAPVLHDFSLTVRRGQTIALVGPTGGGKTTIVSLLCRFYEPTAGEVLINGIDYRKRSLGWLQSCLGIVLQSPHLFSGSIRENIRYGDLAASDEKVAWAARLVNAHPFIERESDGYETQVGEGGGKLSTGQRQLVSFARAILADPQIFVMDEATSSVDTEAERLIQAGLAEVMRGRISFVIAHRLSTIRSADRIVVIDGGRIVEQGTHDELIRLGGRYYELYTNQFTQERREQILAEG